MIDVRNRVYTRIKHAVAGKCEFCTQELNVGMAEFPCVYYNYLDSPVTKSDLMNSESAIMLVIQMEVYTQGTGGLNSAYEIMNLVCTEMSSMKFKRSYGPQNMSDLSGKKTVRLVARFNRLVADGDRL